MCSIILFKMADTKSNIFSRAALFFFCFSADFLYGNFNTSERCFLTTLAGYPLSFRSDLKFLMFCSNVALEEFVLRSLNHLSLNKAIRDAWW